MKWFWTISLLCVSLIYGDDITSSAPYISGNTFRSICDHHFDEYTGSMSPEKVRCGDIVFVKSDYLEKFFRDYHPHIQYPYVLVSHNADHGVEGRYAHYLDEGKVYQWFGQNCADFTHPRLHPIPIGIANKKWLHGRTVNFDQAIKHAKKTSKRNLVSYLGISHTNPAVRMISDRYFLHQPWCHVLERTSHIKYLRNLSRSEFTICPAGNGLDTHRIWEALLLGSKPIVIRSNGDEMFKGLPVMLVHSWEEVTPDSLSQYKNWALEQHFQMEKIYKDYWTSWIKKVSNECRREN